MKKVLFILMFFYSICTLSYALDNEEIKLWANEITKTLKLKETIERIEAGEIDTHKLQIIFFILKNTGEHYCHNLNGVLDNQVFVHPDGHSEAVYDKNGVLVEDGINDGSYNYFSRTEQPLKHFIFDIQPWIRWGNSRKDTTSKRERICAYISDFENGLRVSLENKEDLNKIKADNWDSEGQLQTLAFFVYIQETFADNSLFSLFEEKITENYQKELRGKIILALQQIEIGFKKLY